MPVILSNGDVCDDEDIYGSQIHDYLSDDDYIDYDEQYEQYFKFPEAISSDLIDRFEFRIAMNSRF